MQSSLRFTRLYTDEAGESHFGQVEIEVVLRQFAPPASPFGVSALASASQCGFLHLPEGWVGEMHPSPIRMWIFVLSGAMEFEAGDGEEHLDVNAERLRLGGRDVERAGAQLLLAETTQERW